MFQNAVLFMLGAVIPVGTCILMRRSFFSPSESVRLFLLFMYSMEFL